MARKKSSVNQAAIERILRAFTNSGITLLRTELTPDGKVVMFHNASNHGEEVMISDQALDAWLGQRDTGR